MSEEPHERLYRLVRELMDAVPPIDPPFVHWLTSDASASYCDECIDQARADELRVVFIPEKPQKFTWQYTADDDVLADFARFFEEGIDGGFEGMSSDHAEYCECCGKTLWYTLTDYGVADELIGWTDMLPFSAFTAEDSHALYILTLDLTWAGADAGQIALALQVAESAKAALASPTPVEKDDRRGS